MSDLKPCPYCGGEANIETEPVKDEMLEVLEDAHVFTSTFSGPQSDKMNPRIKAVIRKAKEES